MPSTGQESPAPTVASRDHLAPVLARARCMMGDNVADWTATHTAAWEGFLELGRQLRRDVEAHVEERHQLSVSMLGIMGRLARAPERTLRQTDLADAMGLSLSRTSRVIDILEARGLVVRHRCPTDARATNVELTSDGRARTTAAQETVHRFVQDRFMSRLSPSDLTTLADVFTRLLTPSADLGSHGACEHAP